MATTQAPDPQYTLEQAQSDIAALRGQLALQAEVVSTVTDKAVLLYAPGANAIPRGPTFWSFEDGTTDSWFGNSGAVTNSVVTASGWPTDGTNSLLLTANGGTVPQAESPGMPTQPGDPVAVHMDIYCPAAQTNVFVSIAWVDDTGTFISNVVSPLTSFSAGQVQTLYVTGTAPDLTAFFAVTFGSNNTLAAGQLIYGDNINALGNLSISISPGGGTDPVGNPYPAGMQLRGQQQVFRLTTGDAGEASAGTVLVGTVGAVGPSRQLITEIFSPALRGGRQTAVLALISQSADGTVPPSAVLGQPLTLSGQSSAPPTPTSAGIVYVDATGHLRYLGPSGTNTILANP